MRKTDLQHSVVARLAPLAMLVGVAGCLHGPPRQLAAASSCQAGDRAMVRDVLYFGRNRPDGGKVADDQWQAFLDQVVTPRFPDGLTVASATGQWRGASGQVETEASQVLTLLHSGDAASRNDVAGIAAEYKRRFGQEAVLRERSAACVAF
jgi:hypothetical protein